MFKFLSRQPFWVNLLAALLLLFLLGFLFLASLNWLTNHGAYLKVPSVKGKKVDEGIRFLEDQGFEVVIQDSLYIDSLPKYTILKQLPDPDATVKANRTVFLTINRAMPPLIDMPKLEGLSFRYALEKLERSHLKLEDTIYRPDFMKGSVLEQQYHSQRIGAGYKVPWGSGITLIIGAGLQLEQVRVPDLLGLTFTEAKQILADKGISLAAVVPMAEVKDTFNAFVYKQNPETFDIDSRAAFIQPGQTMDIWLSPIQINADSLRKQNKQDILQ
ncbi:MAG: PASTA domain-containing protein [Ginsengibacter sp.]